MTTDDEIAARAFLVAVQARMKLHLEDAVDCLSQLNDQQVWFRAPSRDNAIGNLVMHVVGSLGQIVGKLEGSSHV